MLGVLLVTRCFGCFIVAYVFMCFRMMLCFLLRYLCVSCLVCLFLLAFAVVLGFVEGCIGNEYEFDGY